mmetsp:Transcript_8692/g.26697  ORF Transcript_8692/g.26697 Transcript_8692/m.26697 type:complete len:214 (-) Transcript_8692:254-895(-)
MVELRRTRGASSSSSSSSGVAAYTAAALALLRRPTAARDSRVLLTMLLESAWSSSSKSSSSSSWTAKSSAPAQRRPSARTAPRALSKMPKAATKSTSVTTRTTATRKDRGSTATNDVSSLISSDATYGTTETSSSKSTVWTYPGSTLKTPANRSIKRVSVEGIQVSYRQMRSMCSTATASAFLSLWRPYTTRNAFSERTSGKMSSKNRRAYGG